MKVICTHKKNGIKCKELAVQKIKFHNGSQAKVCNNHLYLVDNIFHMVIKREKIK